MFKFVLISVYLPLRINKARFTRDGRKVPGLSTGMDASFKGAASRYVSRSVSNEGCRQLVHTSWCNANQTRKVANKLNLGRIKGSMKELEV